MGFDIDCVIDIRTYPGEFFCPVCRTLVYPQEALQSPCTHLYCRPCLAHVANGSRTCPYDGCMVTESDFKPLTVSDIALAERIGKVKVHCLYFRSGCKWEGCLSDCTSHCLECLFGNSQVICNKCGVQMMHRHGQDHAQTCSGAYKAQHAGGGRGILGAAGTAVGYAQHPQHQQQSHYQQSNQPFYQYQQHPVAEPGQVLQQKQPYVQPQDQFLWQNLPPPPHNQVNQPLPHAQEMGMQHAAQNSQIPQYQQPYVQMHHHPQASLAQLQPQMHPQPKAESHIPNQVHDRPQAPQQFHHPVPPSHPNQPTVVAALMHAPHPPVPPVGDNLPHQQQMQLEASQRKPMLPNSPNRSLPHVQVHDRVLQQPYSHGVLSQQRSSAILTEKFSPQSQFLGISAPQQQLHHVQLPVDPLQLRDAVQPIQREEGGTVYSVERTSSGNPLHDGRFPPMSDHLKRGVITGGPKTPRFGEHMVSGPLDYCIRKSEVFGQDGPGGHVMVTELSRPGYFPNNSNMFEVAGHGATPIHSHVGVLGDSGKFPPHPPFRESGGGEVSRNPHVKEPMMRNNCFLPSRKRQSVSTGWCHVCNIDCETAAGLDIHLHSREHRRAMDLVKVTRQQSCKKQRGA